MQIAIAIMGTMSIGVVVVVGMLVWDAVCDFIQARRLDRDNRN